MTAKMISISNIFFQSCLRTRMIYVHRNWLTIPLLHIAKHVITSIECNQLLAIWRNTFIQGGTAGRVFFRNSKPLPIFGSWHTPSSYQLQKTTTSQIETNVGSLQPRPHKNLVNTFQWQALWKLRGDEYFVLSVHWRREGMELATSLV